MSSPMMKYAQQIHDCQDLEELKELSFKILEELDRTKRRGKDIADLAKQITEHARSQIIYDLGKQICTLDVKGD